MEIFLWALCCLSLTLTPIACLGFLLLTPFTRANVQDAGQQVASWLELLGGLV